MIDTIPESLKNRVHQGEKFVWLLPQQYDTLMDLASKYRVAPPLMHTLLSRGIDTPEKIDSFLFTSYEKDVPDPALLKDAEKSVDRLLLAIEKGEKILIAGDYDVDGISSSALILECLLPLGADINFFLPNRVRDGYGLSTKIITRAADNNYKVVITVDNGITAFEPARLAKERGVDLIITDHHRPHAEIPDAFALVDPMQEGCDYPFKSLAGVGVAFKLMALLYRKKGLEMPPKVYELLLLGTVADVVPLVGENRYWVRHGLQQINLLESTSIKVLKKNGKVTKSHMSSTDIGFSITPQINALGRLEDARQGVQFLIGADEQQTEHVGKILLELNEARKNIERQIIRNIEREIEEGHIDLTKENVIFAASDKWPPGVIGLVASRMVSAYGKPTLLFHLTKDGLAKGSCRSIPEFNMFDALQSGEKHLNQFGGHSLAAGLSLPIENLPRLKQHLEDRVAEQLTPFDLQLKLSIDAEVTMPDLHKRFMHDMQLLEPFGNSNRSPIFYLRQVTLAQEPQILKDLHVKLRVFADGIIKPVMFFNRPALYEKLVALDNESFDLAVQVVENHWNGSVNIELMGVDISFNKE